MPSVGIGRPADDRARPPNGLQSRLVASLQTTTSGGPFAESGECPMRKLAFWAATGVLVFGTGCAESLVQPPPSETLFMPDTPVWSTDALPDVPTDHWSELATTYLAPPPRPIRRSISLGFIGDEPLGRFDPKPSALAKPASDGQAPNARRYPSRSPGRTSW
jgi:hypothetical protein